MQLIAYNLLKQRIEPSINDLMSLLDNPRDCEYNMGELLDVLSRHWNINGQKLLGQATFGLADTQAERKGT